MRGNIPRSRVQGLEGFRVEGLEVQGELEAASGLGASNSGWFWVCCLNPEALTFGLWVLDGS